jgi:nucleotide-binding universal stress UspA family protein
MFRHLLVTLDGSPRAEAVVPHAIDVARSMGAEITLLRVVDPIATEWGERGAMGKTTRESLLAQAFVDQAQAYLDRVAARVASQGVRVHTSVKQGQAGKAVVQAARDCKADAIAMAARTRRGLGRLVFGGGVEDVVQESGLPVLLVRAE